MAVPATILDGTPPTGTKGTVTINSVVYIIESESLTPSWSEATDRTGAGLPGRARYVKQRYKLDLVLQLATAATAYPPPGTTFTYQIKNETSTTTFIVRDVPEERNNSEGFIETVKISCIEAIGAVTTT